MDTGGGEATTSEVSINPTCRHPESGVAPRLIRYNMNSPIYVKITDDDFFRDDAKMAI